MIFFENNPATNEWQARMNRLYSYSTDPCLTFAAVGYRGAIPPPAPTYGWHGTREQGTIPKKGERGSGVASKLASFELQILVFCVLWDRVSCLPPMGFEEANSLTSCVLLKTEFK